MLAEPRTRFQGVAQIVRFNWPFYVAATLILVAGACAVFLFSMSPFLRTTSFAVIAAAAFWLIVSLLISHYVYDQAGIYSGLWIERALRVSPKRWASFHAGLDEFSGIIRNGFPDGEGLIVDFFDPNEMTEPSIKRARHSAKQSAESIKADFRALTLPDNELDVAFLFFSAHELREGDSRIKFFTELRRVLCANGEIILLEHLRDWPNFFAFGPGCFHFHSRRTWISTIKSSGFALLKEFTLTPFVRAFVLEKSLPNVER